MPLDRSTLQSALESLFADPPLTAAECAQAWADAVGSYAAGIIPTSTTVAAAASALMAALPSAFASPSAFDGAFHSFAVTVAAGMLPLFTGAAPTSLLGIIAPLSGSHATHADAAFVFAGQIDEWLKTGKSILVLPPHTLVQWS